MNIGYKETVCAIDIRVYMKKRNCGKVDERALGILVKNRATPTKEIPEADLSYASSRGYLFEDKDTTHDESIDWLFREYEKANKKHVTDLFLASLSTNQVSWRVGLSVYAIMQTFPIHTYQTLSDNITKVSPCMICSGYSVYASFNYMNLMRIVVGKLLFHSPYNYAFCLQEHNKISKEIKPNEKDFELFRQLIIFIHSHKEIKGTTELLKCLKKSRIFILCDDEQLHALIELLGYCCILESPRHPGPLTQYVNLAVAPRKTHSSEWAYPAGFWTGKDGINKGAYDFWFGNYPELNIDNI
jgi:hypothetical protein